MIHAGFFRRLIGFAIDVVVLAVVGFVALKVRRQLMPIPVELVMVGYFVGVPIYEIAFHAKWGKTLGKLAAGIMVVKRDGTRIFLKDAILRKAVFGSLLLIFACGFMYTFASGQSQSIWTMTSQERQELLFHTNPTGAFYRVAAIVWTIGNIFAVILSKRQAALHDMMAGTLVVVSKSVDRSPTNG